MEHSPLGRDHIGSFDGLLGVGFLPGVLSGANQLAKRAGVFAIEGFCDGVVE